MLPDAVRGENGPTRRRSTNIGSPTLFAASREAIVVQVIAAVDAGVEQ